MSLFKKTPLVVIGLALCGTIAMTGQCQQVICVEAKERTDDVDIDLDHQGGTSTINNIACTCATSYFYTIPTSIPCPTKENAVFLGYFFTNTTTGDEIKVIDSDGTSLHYSYATCCNVHVPNAFYAKWESSSSEPSPSSSYNEIGYPSSYGINFSSVYTSYVDPSYNDWLDDYSMVVSSGLEYIGDHFVINNVGSGEGFYDGLLFNPSLTSHLNLGLLPNIPLYGFCVNFLLDESSIYMVMENFEENMLMHVGGCDAMNINSFEMVLTPDIDSIEELCINDEYFYSVKFCYYDENIVDLMNDWDGETFLSYNDIPFEYGINDFVIDIFGNCDVEICLQSFDFLYVPNMMINPVERPYMFSYGDEYQPCPAPFSQAPWTLDYEFVVDSGERFSPYNVYAGNYYNYEPFILDCIIHADESITEQIDFGQYVDDHDFFPFYKMSYVNVFEKYLSNRIWDGESDVYIHPSLVFEYDGSWYTSDFCEINITVTKSEQYIPQSTFEPLTNILDLASDTISFEEMYDELYPAPFYETSKAFLFYHQCNGHYDLNSFFNRDGGINVLNRETNRYSLGGSGMNDYLPSSIETVEFHGMIAMYYCDKDDTTSSDKPFKKSGYFLMPNFYDEDGLQDYHIVAKPNKDKPYLCDFEESRGNWGCIKDENCLFDINVVNGSEVDFKLIGSFEGREYHLRSCKDNYSIVLIDINSDEYKQNIDNYAPIHVYVSKYVDENMWESEGAPYPTEECDYVVNNMFENYYLHMRDYTGNYNLCKSNNFGLYQRAKSAFLTELTDSQRNDFRPGGNNSEGFYRLQAWAIANGEILDPETLTFASIKLNAILDLNETNMSSILVIIISIISLISVGGYFYYRKRNEL